MDKPILVTTYGWSKNKVGAGKRLFQWDVGNNDNMPFEVIFEISNLQLPSYVFILILTGLQKVEI